MVKTYWQYPSLFVGMHEETTVRVIKHEGPAGSISETVQQDSSTQQTESVHRSTLDQESILGENTPFV